MRNQRRCQRPFGRSLADFSGLRPAERLLLAACRRGEVAVVAKERPEAPTVENTVRASFLRFLALGGDDNAPIHEHGVRLRGAWIEGEFDLNGGNVPCSLLLRACTFVSAPFFVDARLTGILNLVGSRVPGIVADRVTCGGVFLRDGFTAVGEVRLLGAQIGGDLSCSGAKLENKGGRALSADRAVVKGSVFLNEGFSAVGQVRLGGAQIGGDLTCHGATLESKEDAAFSADGVKVTGDVSLRGGFTAVGEVRLLGAQIGGDLTCRGAKFENKEGDAFSADRAVIKGGAFLNDGFTAVGQVRLLGAQIGDHLTCSGAKLESEGGNAFSADRAVVKGNAFLGEGFTAVGEVRLLGAQIGGNLTCSGANFENKEGDAFSADGMIVEGALLFRNLTQQINGISLASARVSQLADDLDAWGERLQLDGFVYDAIVGGAPTDAASRLAWLRKDVLQPFRPQPWRQLQKVLREMGHAEDAREVAIAFEEELRKRDLIGQAPANWYPRLARLHRQAWRTLHGMFGILIGYGHRPLRLLAWMIGVWFFCGLFYWYAALDGVFAPSNPLVFQHPAYVSCVSIPPKAGEGNKGQQGIPLVAKIRGGGNWYLFKDLPEEYTGFSPLAYSLDVILPLVNLQQENDWAPMIPTPQPRWYHELFSMSLKHFTRWVLWFEILFGWLASLLLVAVVSGLTKRREE